MCRKVERVTPVDREFKRSTTNDILEVQVRTKFLSNVKEFEVMSYSLVEI